MDRNKAKDFLGTGWKFPVTVDENTGRIVTSSYEEDIEEAIKIIIMTKNGERMMNPEFGCRINEYIFKGMDYTTITQMESQVKRALVMWEPRITDVDVSVDVPDESGQPTISISYVVRATNNPYNLVYPYYINEGHE